MWHICNKSGQKWNCYCGSRCGYPKDGLCHFHREDDSENLQDLTFVMRIGAMEPDSVCSKGHDEQLSLIRELVEGKRIELHLGDSRKQ